MKPVLHFAPAAGWFNDPNGLIDHRGVHHFFFQHNPDKLAMEHMCWGHATSTDLLSWTEHPIALTPGPPGSFDDDGCWSGCAVHDGDRVVAVYSGHHAGIELPCLARALDDELLTWEKDAANPVVDRRPAVAGITDMRDHSVRRDGGTWRQVLAGGAAGEGMLFGYSSTDLVHWSWDGIVLRAGDVDLPGQVWECPDVFQVGDQAVAIISVMDHGRSPVIWVTGRFEGTAIVANRWGLLDHGDRLYAPQSYTDHTGRRIMFGWLRTHMDPAALGQQNLGVASLPRILSLVDGHLHQQPAAEIAQLRGASATGHPGLTDTSMSIGVDHEPAFEIAVSWPATTALLATSIDLVGDDGRTIAIDLERFSAAGHRLDDGRWVPDSHQPHRATLIFDSGIVEVFLDDGRAFTTTDAALTRLGQVRLRWTGEAPVEVTTSPLRRVLPP